MPYDRIIRIDIRGPHGRNAFDESQPGPVISSQLHWAERIDGGVSPVLSTGGFRNEQEIIYRLRYLPELLTTDPGLIDVYDELPFTSANGRIDPYRAATPRTIHETTKGRRRETEIAATLEL